ncbi:hopanoid biosynthesis-associated protein HpnK [Acidithiobacillus sp. YTS05]|uniref:hopanoid biosynthesis-associated protein HpnK n=1 Tax=Igneacidithiobacillus copahuensis TaxID=2724909 RepID=UPI002102EFB7|nr:hopanoid biosynthesis-associated protein HpnK [Acidithiobacillus sp. YTS05]
MANERKVIFNADDFGLDASVNAAVASAHQYGVLNSASLMVSAAAASEAIQLARNLPDLGVGLHLTLVDGYPVLPAAQVPDLVDAHGRFAADLWRRGVRYFFLPRVRRQLAAEIAAQYAAFADSGLHLDHVNAHKHLHAHPTVLHLLIEIGKRFALRAVRIPREPLALARQLAPVTGSAALGARLLLPWVARMRHVIRSQGLFCNDLLLGLQSTGQMDADRLQRALAVVPAGQVTELYFHPAQEQTTQLRQLMPDYRPAAEWRALCAPELAANLRAQGIRTGTYHDFACG